VVFQCSTTYKHIWIILSQVWYCCANNVTVVCLRFEIWDSASSVSLFIQKSTCCRHSCLSCLSDVCSVFLYWMVLLISCSICCQSVVQCTMYNVHTLCTVHMLTLLLYLPTPSPSTHLSLDIQNVLHVRVPVTSQCRMSNVECLSGRVYRLHRWDWWHLVASVALNPLYMLHATNCVAHCINKLSSIWKHIHNILFVYKYVWNAYAHLIYVSISMRIRAINNSNWILILHSLHQHIHDIQMHIIKI